MINNVYTKVKFVSADFDAETGVSTVVISTPYGNFSGSSRLHPDDAPYASRYTGFEYAEMRAHIKYMKARIKEVNAQMKVLKMLKSTVTEGTDGAFKIRKFIGHLEEERKYWNNLITVSEQKIKDMIVLRDELVEKLYKRAE